MKQLFAFILTLTLLISVKAQNVSIHYNSASPQARYAVKMLEPALTKSGYKISASKADFTISIIEDAMNLPSEAFDLAISKNKIMIKGGDGRAIIYGSLSLAEDLRNGTKLDKVKARHESSQLPLRAIKYDLPWDTYRHSYSLDQHQATCKDLNYWEAFLDMMAENRINALSLWNLHPYTYMIRPKNFPEASPWNDAEMAEWKKLFGGIFRMAAERGIEIYIIPFNIFVTPEFSKAHNVAMDNLEHHFFVRGDTSEIVKRYTRECVTQLLQEYPEITGMGLTLGEGMAGMTPQQREDWMKATIIEGMRQAGRKLKLVHRIPFSSTTGSLGPTSVEMEQITRKGIEQEANMDFIEKPVWADLKFNWSHAHSTPKLIKVHGGKLYGTYWSPAPKDYKITWTARNEDFFCLRWGVADFVRDHINTNSPAYVGGYFIGSETYIPAKDYFTKPGLEGNWKYAFERQWLFYKIWGRLLYNTQTPNNIFRDEFVRRFGKNGSALYEAYTLSGTTPLRLASSFDFTWDFSLYSEGFMALDNTVKRVDFITVDRTINQPTLDPDYVSVKDYVKTVEENGAFSKERITPPMLASMLERDCAKALALVKDINVTGNNTMMYEVADVKIWSNLGLYFAEKLKGAVALQTYRVKGGEENKAKAVQHLEKALQLWRTIVTITRPIYNDMPLVHYSEQDGKHWKENDHLRFHWEKLIPNVERDIEIAKNAKVVAAD